MANHYDFSPDFIQHLIDRLDKQEAEIAKLNRRQMTTAPRYELANMLPTPVEGQIAYGEGNTVFGPFGGITGLISSNSSVEIVDPGGPTSDLKIPIASSPDSSVRITYHYGTVPVVYHSVGSVSSQIYSNTPQIITSGGGLTYLTFTGVNWDDSEHSTGMANLGVNNDRLTTWWTGLYLAIATTSWDTSPTDNAQRRIIVVASTGDAAAISSENISGQGLEQTAIGILRLVAPAYVRVACAQQAGANRNILGGSLTLHRLTPFFGGT